MVGMSRYPRRRYAATPFRRGVQAAVDCRQGNSSPANHVLAETQPLPEPPHPWLT